MNWSDLSEWWRSELESDPAYEEVVTPLLLDVLEPRLGASYLELGCGEGRVMRAIAARGGVVHGIDLSIELAQSARNAMVARLPGIPIRNRSYDGIYSTLALEHIEDHGAFFREAARVTRQNGTLAIVINHPTWTAPESTPVTDDDGEVLWRPGAYFSQGSSEVLVGDSSITFYHRSMSMLFNEAAAAGWRLARMIERPHHLFEGQSGIPRLLACRWIL